MPGGVVRLPRAVAVAVLVVLLALFVIGIPLAGSWLAASFPEISNFSLFGVLLAFFAGVLAVFSVVVVMKARAVRRWAPATATVIESQVVWGSGHRGGRTLVPRLTYQYEVGGRAYQSKRIAFHRRTRGIGAQELVARLPVGSRVQIHYDPAQPAEAVLDHSFPALWLLPFFAVVLAVLAGVFFALPGLLGG